MQFHGEAPPPEALLRETWNDVITRRVYGQDHPPRWLLVLSFSRVLLIERGKWTHNRLLRFDLDEILGRREDATLKAAAALLHRDCLLPPDGQSLLDSLDDNSHKHAFAVSEDLKYALRAGMPALHVPAAVLATLVKPTRVTRTVPADRDDGHVIGAASAARADAIATGDGDLLRLDPWQGIRILPPAEVLRLANTREIERQSS